MPSSIKGVAMFEDSTGRRAPVVVNFEDTNTLADVRAAMRDVIQKVDNISDCMFVSANIITPIEFSWFGALTLKTQANENDVENKGRFEFVSDSNDSYTVEIPGIMNSVIDDDTNLIEVTSGAGQAFVDAILTNGFVDGVVNLNAVNTHGDPLIRLTGAYQRFRKSRRQRSAIKVKR